MTGSFGMEWNSKTPLQWDWENLVLFSSKVNEIPNQVQRSEWVIDNGSMYSSGGGGCSGSDLGNGCSSRSSISDSTSKVGLRKSEINFEAVVEGFSKDHDNKNEVSHGVEDPGTLPEFVTSVGSGEPLIGLKLGKRTYFEDICAGDNLKNTSFPMISPSSTATVKKSRVSNQRMHNICCQVEGCNLDLTAAKEYHRKHRVCENHSKCPKVIVAGHERRFCQQCSRFHDLSEFDQKKRSCRRRLSDHNARRRKPQPGTISFNSAMLSSPVYDNRQHMNFLLNKPPFGHLRPTANSTWDGSLDFKFTQTKGSWIRSTNAGDVGGQLRFPSNEMSNAVSTIRHDIDRLLPFKSTTAEGLNQGLEASIMVPNLNGTPDLRRALSLLSTGSWVSANPGSTSSLNPLVHDNSASGVQIAMPAMHHPSTDYCCWTTEVQPLSQEMQTRPGSMHGSNGELQQFELFKTPPYDGGGGGGGGGGALLDSNRIH